MWPLRQGSLTVTVQNAQLFELAFRDAAGQLVPAAAVRCLMSRPLCRTLSAS